jgi:ankyrin repeat protein
LLPVSDPKACNSSALRWAANNGHLEIVKLFLPVSDPKADYSEALRRATENGHLEIVKLFNEWDNQQP